MSVDTLLSPAQVAERLGVSRLTAVRWLRSGKLKGEKLGRKTVRMWASDLDAFIQGQAPALTLVQPQKPRAETAQAPILEPDTLALADKLRQAGESMNDVIHRALLALQAHAMQAPAPMSGEHQPYEQRKAALVQRMRTVQGEW
jgi:excisionase family DNA binding protein